MGWPEAMVAIVGLVVLLASVGGTVYTARLSIKAEGDRQRRAYEQEVVRRWSEQAAQAVGRAEMALAALTGLRDLNESLVATVDLEDMQERLANVAAVRVDLRTVAALSINRRIIDLLDDVERRLQTASVVVAAVINGRSLSRGDHEALTSSCAKLRPVFRELLDGSGEEVPRSFSAKELFLELRDHLGRSILMQHGTS